MSAKPEPPKLNRYTFRVYRQQDVANFCGLLDREEASLAAVVRRKPQRDWLADGFDIAYEHTEELDMPIFT